MKVLVVDDYEDTRDGLRLKLEHQKIQVVAVGRGLHALLQYHTALSMGEPFDAIVLDGALPDIPGALVAKVIRQLEQFPSAVPVTRLVYYSGHADLLTAKQREDAQFDVEIVKPGEPHALLAAIVARISERR